MCDTHILVDAILLLQNQIDGWDQTENKKEDVKNMMAFCEKIDLCSYIALFLAFSRLDEEKLYLYSSNFLLFESFLN